MSTTLYYKDFCGENIHNTNHDKRIITSAGASRQCCRTRATGS